MAIGIMQGRLSPMIDGKIQAFPWDTWEEEFEIAADIGFDEIEFIFESHNFQMNPLVTDEGCARIKELIKKNNVQVNYVCADYFMEKPFIRVSEKDKRESIDVLKMLITHCAERGIKGIEIPLVDNSKIDTDEEALIVVECLKEVIPVAEEFNISLGLETSLNPDDFVKLLQQLDHPLIKANYDTGNSASLGYNTEEEILKLGKWINNVHIKDRILGGGSVPLGTGNANLNLSFKMLSEIGYEGSFILQTARGDNDIEEAKKNLGIVKRLLRKHFGLGR